MADGMNKPAIRFAGFTDAWEQRKLGDCFDERNESMPDGELISVTINDGIRKFSELGRHDNSNDDKSKYKKVCVGDIAYNSMRMWQGASGYSPYEGIVSPAYTVLSPKTGVVSRCLAYQFKLPEMIHTFQVNSQGITSDNWNLKYPAFSEIEIAIAKQVKEQELIASFFTSLDNLITLHQREYAKLVNIKASMLEKMFPKDGSAYPEVRFAGFTDAWEQRKFEDLYDYASEGGTPDTNNPAFYEGGKIPFVKIEDTVEKYIDSPKSYITEEGMNHSSAWLIPKGNVIFTNGATVGNVAINRLPVTTKQGILGIIPSKKVTSEFLFYLLSSTEFQREVRSRMATGTFATIILKSLNEIPVCFPSNTNEQESIITILSKLDNLITLHQRDSIMRFFGAWDNANAWEQRKFSDVVATRRGLTYKPSDIRKNGVRVLRSSNIAEDSFTLSDEDVFVVREAVNIDCARANDILITAANGSSRLVGKHTIISGIPEESAVHGGFMLLGTTKEPYFINASMGSSWYRRFIELYVAGGNGAIGNLNKNDLDNQVILIPREPEQQAIGAFFKQLDNLITLHQRERKNRLFGGKNVKQYNFSRLVLQLLRAMDSRLQRRGSSQGDYG